MFQFEFKILFLKKHFIYLLLLLFDSGGSGKGVRPVYLRCSRGTVSWRYPRGALRVVLSGGEGFNGFHACVKVSGPARVYLEGKTSLRPVYSPNDGKHESYHRCFRSNGKLAALYVEADESSPDYKWKVVQLQYDLEREEKKEENECMPCSKEELAKTYCQSDLVARGTLSAVEKKTDLDDLVLRVTKILSDINEVYKNASYFFLYCRISRNLFLNTRDAELK